MKKYKEFRCVIEMSIFTALLIITGLYLGFLGSFDTMTILFVIAVITSFSISYSYNVTIDQDEITYYKWFFIIMYTKKVSIKEIRTIKAVTKRKVELTLKDNSTIPVYVFNAEEFTKDAMLFKNKKRSDRRKNRR